MYFAWNDETRVEKKIKDNNDTGLRDDIFNDLTFNNVIIQRRHLNVDIEGTLIHLRLYSIY